MDAILSSSFWIQPWFYPDATCSCPSSQSHSTSDKPVYIQLLLEDLLVGHGSIIMQFKALCIFHSGEGTTYYFAAGILLLKYLDSFAKIRDVAFKFVSLLPKSLLVVNGRKTIVYASKRILVNYI